MAGRIPNVDRDAESREIVNIDEAKHTRKALHGPAVPGNIFWPKTHSQPGRIGPHGWDAVRKSKRMFGTDEPKRSS